MRFPCLLTVAACILFMGACNRQQRRNREIERGEGVVVKPQDALYINFEQNWKQLINQTPEMILPVVPPKETPPPVQPLVFPQCVFSADAGRMAAQVTIVWNEPPARIILEGPRLGKKTAQAALAQQQPPAASAQIRFDIGVDHDSLARGYFSSALATDRLKRFMLPSNSPLLQDTRTVAVTGPGLFPKLMDFKTQSLTDRDTKQQFSRQELVLSDLKQGLTYALRVSRLSGNQWNDERQFAFVAPVCPNRF